MNGHVAGKTAGNGKYTADRPDLQSCTHLCIWRGRSAVGAYAENVIGVQYNYRNAVYRCNKEIYGRKETQGID